MFPNMYEAPDDLIAEGDMLMARWTWLSDKNAGNPIMMIGLQMNRFADGKIAERWSVRDHAGNVWDEPMEITGDPGSPEANKAVVNRWVDDLWNAGALSATDEIIANGIVIHDPTFPEARGLEGYKRWTATTVIGFPDQQTSIENIFAEGDKAAVFYTWSGTRTGGFPDVPPTGERVTMEVMIIFRVADGKIVESWSLGAYNTGLIPPEGLILPQEPASVRPKGKLAETWGGLKAEN